MAPSQRHIEKGVHFIQENVKRDEGSVYVHCKAGRSRSATLVACYLIAQYDWSPEEAIEFIKEKRPHISLGKIHMEAISEYFASRRESKDQVKTYTGLSRRG